MWRWPTTPMASSTLRKLVAKARAWKGLVGLDLAKDVTCAQSYRWDEHALGLA